jgi:hypothetical protein
MYSLALIIFVVSEKKAFEQFPIGSNVDLFNIGPYGKNVSKRFFSETKLPRNDHWKVLCFLCRSEIISKALTLSLAYIHLKIHR